MRPETFKEQGISDCGNPLFPYVEKSLNAALYQNYLGYRVLGRDGTPRWQQLFQKRLSGGRDGHLLQLGRDGIAFGVGFGGGQALAQVDDLILSGAAAANFRPATRCGHEGLLQDRFASATPIFGSNRWYQVTRWKL